MILTVVESSVEIQISEKLQITFIMPNRQNFWK
jgi:hypothetical protein